MVLNSESLKIVHFASCLKCLAIVISKIILEREAVIDVLTP